MRYVGADLEVINTPWSENSSYELGQMVWHQGMYYKSKMDIYPEIS